jgi:hypothetical protein
MTGLIMIGYYGYLGFGGAMTFDFCLFREGDKEGDAA